MRTTELKDQVKQLIAAGKLSECIELLLTYRSDNQFVLLAGRYQQVARDHSVGLLSQEDYYVYQARIAQKLLEQLDERFSDPSKVLQKRPIRKRWLLALAFLLSFVLFPGTWKSLASLSILVLAALIGGLSIQMIKEPVNGSSVPTTSRPQVERPLAEVPKPPEVSLKDTLPEVSTQAVQTVSGAADGGQEEASVRSDTTDKSEEKTMKSESPESSLQPTFRYTDEVVLKSRAAPGEKIRIVVELLGFRTETEFQFLLDGQYQLPFSKIDAKRLVVNLVASDKTLPISMVDQESNQRITAQFEGTGNYDWKVKRQLRGTSSIGVDLPKKQK